LKSDTGISFVQVSLTGLNFILNKKYELPKDGIPVDIGIDVKTSFSKDKKTLIVVLSAKLFYNTKEYPFKMKIAVEGVFSGEDHKKLKEFSSIHAPAHLMPFLREAIGNTTMKANIPPLLLPPINLVELLKSKGAQNK
jgi:preprotein translocase subunit SecB